MRRSFFLAAVLCAAACGGGSEEEQPRGCEPGATVACVCDGGDAGTAVCGEDRVPGSCSCAGTVGAAPAAVDFGDVPRGETREATLLLSTRGTQPVAVTDAVVEGDPGFAVISFPYEVPAGGGGAPVVVSFRSDRPVEAEGDLLLRTAAGDVTVPLTARAVGALVECDSTELTWTDSPLGGENPRWVTCTNHGLAGEGNSAVVEFLAVEAPPEFHPEFPLGLTYGPGESFFLGATYLPLDVGEDVGEVRWTLRDAPPVVFSLSANAVAVRCELEAWVHTFRSLGVPGEELFGSVEFMNLGGAGCQVSSFETGDCDDGFTLEFPEPTLLLRNTALSVPFRFRSEELGPHSCTVRAVADDPDGSVFEAPVALELSWRQCLVLEGPSTVPAVSPSCGTSPLLTSLVNTCRGDFQVSGIRIAEGSAPGFSAGPIEPTTLAPGASLPVLVGFNAEEQGASFVGTLEVTSQLDPEPWTFALVSSSGPDAIFKDQMVQEREEPVDVLVVIDNGAGMGPEAARILAELGSLPVKLRGYDYHLAVTTTGLAPEAGGACPGGVFGGEDGRLFPVDGSRPRVITPATPNARAVWEQNLAVGTCQTGPARPLQAAALAVSAALDVADDPRHPEVDDGNAGFLRPGVPLRVVVLGDRDDASPGTTASYLDAIVAAKGGDPTMVDAVIVAGDPGNGCIGADGSSAAAGDRLHEFAVAVPGIEISICDPAWGVLNLFPQILRQYFPLGEPAADRNEDGFPNEPDVLVSVAFVDVPAVAPDGTQNWTLAAGGVGVNFWGQAIPPPRSLVRIERLYCPPR